MVEECAWIYYGVDLWEVALLTGHVEAAWMLMKQRNLRGRSASPEAVSAYQKRRSLELEDWKWILSSGLVTVTIQDEDGAWQRGSELAFSYTCFYLALRKGLGKF